MKIREKFPPEIQCKTAQKKKFRKFHEKISPGNQFKSENKKRKN